MFGTHAKAKQFSHKLRNNQAKSFIGFNPALSGPLPDVLEPGMRWLGGIESNEEWEEISINEYLFFGVQHFCDRKLVLQRVIIETGKLFILDLLTAR